MLSSEAKKQSMMRLIWHSFTIEVRAGSEHYNKAQSFLFQA
jgi:hypothetical protein